jgi:hypothetical protein
MSKYLFYTLGEILLVVIGILIALKINNWNENNKNRYLEEQYYCRIHEDILQDHERIDQLLSNNTQRKSDANQLLRIILNEEYNTREILLQYIKTIRGSSINFVPNDATWEDLKSSGNLNLIKDINIKKALNNYFKSLEPLINTNQVYIDYVSNQYFKLTELSKQTGMVSVELATDEVGVAAFKFEKDIIEKLKEYEIDQIPEEFQDSFFNLAYNVAVNMERRTQLFGAIKEEILITEEVLEKKCLEVNKN